MRDKPLTNAGEQKFMDEIKSKGYDDPSYTRDAQGTIQRVHGKLWNNMMAGSMYVFGKSEQWIRGTTMLAAYRLAMEKAGMTPEHAIELAHEASNKAHGIYGKATLPSWAQGTGAAAKLFQVLYTYQKYPHNYLQMLYDVGVSKKNVKGFLFGLMSPIVLGGAAVTPFKDLITGAVGAMLKAMGIKIDPEKWFWDKVRKNYGATTEKIGRYGALGAMGLDVSGSLVLLKKHYPKRWVTYCVPGERLVQALPMLKVNEYGMIMANLICLLSQVH